MNKLKEIKIISLHLIFFIFTLIIIQQFIYPDLFNKQHFLNWDAQHYFEIQKNGYEGFLVAFFPFFPMIWKVTGFGIYGIVFFNAIVYIICFYFLMRSMVVNYLELAFYLSIPSSIFFFLPYTESVFFLSATILLLGIKKERFYLVLLGLFMCILSRPSFTILLPSLVLMDVFNYLKNNIIWIRLFSYLLVSLLGVFFVGWIQFLDTGQWFKFFEVQQGWGNYLQIPKLPLTSWGGNMITRLDGIALFFGLLSGLFLLFFMLKRKLVEKINLPNEVFLSLAYLGGITLLVLFFRGGSLFSLNRFVFAVPFILVVLNYYLKLPFSITWKQLLYIFIFFIFYWLLFGSYVHIQAFLKFVLVSIYLILFFALKHNHKSVAKYSWILLILISFFFQIFFYTYFLNTKGEIGWVG